MNLRSRADNHTLCAPFFRKPSSHDRFLLMKNRVKLAHKECVGSVERKNARIKGSNWLKRLIEVASILHDAIRILHSARAKNDFQLFSIGGIMWQARV